MTVEVILKDGKRIYPSFDPEHRNGVLEYYSELFERGEIIYWGVM